MILQSNWNLSDLIPGSRKSQTGTAFQRRNQLWDQIRLRLPVDALIPKRIGKSVSLGRWLEVGKCIRTALHGFRPHIPAAVVQYALGRRDLCAVRHLRAGLYPDPIGVEFKATLFNFGVLWKNTIKSFQRFQQNSPRATRRQSGRDQIGSSLSIHQLSAFPTSTVFRCCHRRSLPSPPAW